MHESRQARRDLGARFGTPARPRAAVAGARACREDVLVPVPAAVAARDSVALCGVAVAVL